MDAYNRGYDPGISISGSVIGNATIIKDSFVLGETTILGETYRNDQLSSFYGIAYQIKDTNGNITDTVISYRGTDDPTGEYLFDGARFNTINAKNAVANSMSSGSFSTGRQQ